MKTLNKDYIFSEHAFFAVTVREIDNDWLLRCLEIPDLTELSKKDESVTYYFKKISENGERVLRVAVNTKVDPKVIVTAYFDRTMRGKL